MGERNIPPIITLSAALITCVMCIYNRAGLYVTLKKVLFVMIIFFFIGVIAQKIVRKVNRASEENAHEQQRKEQEQAAKEMREMKPKNDSEAEGNAEEEEIRQG